MLEHVTRPQGHPQRAPACLIARVLQHLCQRCDVLVHVEVLSVETELDKLATMAACKQRCAGRRTHLGDPAREGIQQQ